jgi:hypothetical protein
MRGISKRDRRARCFQESWRSLRRRVVPLVGGSGFARAMGGFIGAVRVRVAGGSREGIYRVYTVGSLFSDLFRGLFRLFRLFWFHCVLGVRIAMLDRE